MNKFKIPILFIYCTIRYIYNILKLLLKIIYINQIDKNKGLLLFFILYIY